MVLRETAVGSHYHSMIVIHRAIRVGKYVTSWHAMMSKDSWKSVRTKGGGSHSQNFQRQNEKIWWLLIQELCYFDALRSLVTLYHKNVNWSSTREPRSQITFNSFNDNIPLKEEKRSALIIFKFSPHPELDRNALMFIGTGLWKTKEPIKPSPSLVLRMDLLRARVNAIKVSPFVLKVWLGIIETVVGVNWAMFSLGWLSPVSGLAYYLLKPSWSLFCSYFSPSLIPNFVCALSDCFQLQYCTMRHEAHQTNFLLALQRKT